MRQGNDIHTRSDYHHLHFIALNDLESSLKELERAIMVLNLKGLQLYSNVNGRPLDAPMFQPIFEMMARFDLPVWIHPT